MFRFANGEYLYLLALIPLLFDSLFASMAATIMGGLLVATVLTMAVLPVVYAIFYRVKPVQNS